MEDLERHKTVLLLEDDTDLASIIQYILEEEGYIVIKSLPENFREDICKFRPALILLDHWLYKALGSTICENLKADPETCSIPIILTSTDINIKDLASCCKADDLLPKPFDVEVLVEKVSRLMPIPK